MKHYEHVKVFIQTSEKVVPNILYSWFSSSVLLAVSVYCIFVVSLPSSVCQDILDLTLLLL